MNSFHFTRDPIDDRALRRELEDRVCGGYASFEGWVRDHNEGQPVTHLEYEAFEPLGVKEGERILAEAIERFGIERAACVHRVGDLAIGDIAVWVGASSRHRGEAFLACRYIIDEVKHRLPIWKKEHYRNGDSGWVNCERCAAAAHEHEADEPVSHTHGHEHELGASGLAPERTQDTNAQPRPHLAADYSRQMALQGVGAAGQARLRASKVLVVGAGGLGVPVLTYLVGAGVGLIGIVDDDRLEPSNLHRQPLYALADAGKPKVELAAERLRALNPEIELRTHAVRLGPTNGAELLQPYELVIDCTDNFSTKFLLNDLCMRLGKTAILSSVYQFEGQLQVVRPDRGGTCLRCLWPEATRDGLVGNCSEAGVLGPVPGAFGCLQAIEALKILLDLPGQLGDELLLVDLLTNSVSRIRTPRAKECIGGPCARLPDLDAAATGDAAASEASSLELAFEDLVEAERQGFTVIDVREPREVAAAPAPAERVRHIPLHRLIEMARSAPGEGAPDERERPLSPSSKYLLVCASGKRSLAGAQELRAHGFTAAYSLTGGVTALEQPLPA